MSTLMNAHKQWAKRPADETFMSLDAFHAAMTDSRDRAVEASVNDGSLRFDGDGDELVVVGKAGRPALLTNHAAGALASNVGASIDYLGTLPASLAAQCLTANYASQVERKDRVLLFRRERAVDGDAMRLHALTSSKYVRVWNDEISGLALDIQGRSRFSNPEAFRTVSSTKAGAWGEAKVLPVAFGSDRDCFVFMADYSRGISMPGSDHPLARGFFLSNSEVGDGSLVLTLFLFDFACSNMIVWNAENVTEIRIPHRGSIRERFFGGTDSAFRRLAAYAESSARETEQGIRRLRERSIAATTEDTVDAVMAKRIPGLTKGAISAAIEIAEQTPRYGNPLSPWGLVQGLTEVSQKQAYAGSRTALDRAAGKVLTIDF